MADEAHEPGESGDAVTLDPPARDSSGRRALVLWGALAAVAVAAAALAVTAGGGDDGPDRLPIGLGAPGAGSEAATTSDDMAFGGRIVYVADDDLPALGEDAPAYRLSGSISEDRVQQLATALGLTGTPTKADSTWHLETEAGGLEVYEGGGGSWWYSNAAARKDVAESVEAIGGSGTGSAGASPSCPPDLPPEEADRCAAREAEIAAIDGSATPTTHAPDPPMPAGCNGTVCIDPAFPPEQIAPPADLPSESEARRIALDLLAATGLGVDDVVVTVDGPYEAWYISVEPRLDGLVATGLLSSVAVGSNGEVLHASGFLGTPEHVGDYPTVDTRGAIDRLNAQMGSLGDIGVAEPLPVDGDSTSSVVHPDGPVDDEGGGSSGSPGPATGCAAATSDLAETDAGSTSSAEPSVTTTISTPPPDVGFDEPCPPTEPFVPPPPTEIVLHEAERVLMPVSAFDGSNDLYLVAGYRFGGDQDTFVHAVAIAEGALEPVDMDCARPVPATLPCPPGVVRPQVDESGREPSGPVTTVPVGEP